MEEIEKKPSSNTDKKEDSKQGPEPKPSPEQEKDLEEKKIKADAIAEKLAELVENKDDSDSDNEEIKDIEKLYVRTKTNKTMKINEFYEQKRHYFIMTEGGTPIYSRYGDEIKNCSLLATFSAIITKFTIFNGDENSPEKLNYISNENSLIVFFKKGKIVFIALSNNKTDLISFLYSQLELLYYQLLSIVTSERMPVLEEKPSSCSKIISGINESMEQIIEYTNNNMVSLLNAYEVLPIANRNKLNDICTKHRGNALISCIITSNAKEIISLSKSNLINITYSDIILIQCLIMSSDSLRNGESWVPICLPGISSEGFLQLYCNFVVSDKFGILYVTESQEQKYFIDFVNLSRKIYDDVKAGGFLSYIENTINAKKSKIAKIENNNEKNLNIVKEFIKNSFCFNYNSKLDVNQLNNITPAEKISINKNVYNPNNLIKNDPFLKIKYGLIKNKKSGQFFTINIPNNDELTPKERYIYNIYIKLFDVYKSMNSTNIYVNNFFYIEKDNKYSHGIYVTGFFIIFGSFNLFKDNEEILELLKEINKILKTSENDFFINVK